MSDKIKYLDDAGLERLAEDLEYRHPSTFTGTKEAWAALPPERKVLYKIVNFIDDLNQEDYKHPNIFTGTRAEWYALEIDEKKKYLLVCLTDDLAGEEWFLANVVEDGNMNPVTSNAVYQAIKDMNDLIIVKNVPLVFDPTTLIAEVIDSRISANTHARILYDNPSIARTANIDADTAAGKIVFTAQSAPTADVICDIVFIKD